MALWKKIIPQFRHYSLYKVLTASLLWLRSCNKSLLPQAFATTSMLAGGLNQWEKDKGQIFKKNPKFSSRSFVVSGLIFTSLIHFGFIFMYSVRKCSSFLLLQVHSFTSFPAPLVKEVVFFPLYILASFVKDKLSIGSWMAQRQKYRSIEQYRKPRDNLCYPYVILCKSTNLCWEVFNHSVCD